MRLCGRRFGGTCGLTAARIMHRKSQCSSPALSRNHRLFWGLRSNGAIVGFAELAVRADVAGLEGKRVGYVEGLYVILEARQ